MSGPFLVFSRSKSLILQGIILGSIVAGFASFSAQPLSSPGSVTSPCQTAEECFQVAVESIDSSPGQLGQVTEHQARLQQVRTAFPGSNWEKRAGLRLGLLLMESSPATSLQFFQSALQDFPILEDYIRLWMGKAQLKAGHAREAVSLFESVVDQNPRSILKAEALFHAGQAWYEAGNCELTNRRLRKALAISSESPFAPGALLNVGHCALLTQELKAARDVFREIWWRFPTKPEAETAVEILEKNNLDDQGPTLSERYERALSLYKLAQFEDAISELDTFLSKAPKGTDLYEAQYKLATALARLKRYDQAGKVFHELSTSKSRRAGVATVWLARVYLRQNKGSKLLALRDVAHSRHTSGDQQALINVFCGVWLEDQNKTDQAIEAFHQASVVAHSPQRRLDAVWRAGWIYYQLGEYPKAISTFKEMLAISSDKDDHARPLYWMGRAMDQVNQKSQAQTLYREIAENLPYTYYGLLAQSRLEQPLSSLVAVKTQTDVQLPQAGSSTTRLQQDQHYRKALELSGLHLFEESARELSPVIHLYASDQNALSDLLVLAQQAHAHEIGIRTAIRYFSEELRSGRIPKPSLVWLAAYPTGYLPSIQSHAPPGLDPYLVAGLIREESLYNPRAVSRVGALGLMQLMPATANTVARELGLPSPRREALFDGDTNIRLGTSYVNQLLQQFRGNLVRAVAAYNAGPRAVERWISGFGDRSPDEFVELISYRETRRYVKRVLGSYRIYHVLANGSCSASSLDTTC